MRIKLKKVCEAMNFEVVAGESGLDRFVTEDMLNRPGMEFAGFYDYHEPRRIQLIGSKEATFLSTRNEEEIKERVTYLFDQDPPAFVFSKNVVVPEIFITLGNKRNIPVFKSDLRTTPLSSKLYGYLQERLAERISVHGVLLDIGGTGTLITGKSGIGKSETALELIKRGHQLVSDDRVDIFQKDVGFLVVQAPKILSRFMEIRGIGIVDVVQMFGAGAFRENKRIRLVVELEKWDSNKYYDRLGLETQKVKFFDTEITKIIIPVLPGRNVSLLVESAALNEKLKNLGYFGAMEFTKAVNELAKGNGVEEDE